jgi:hypothetical protein
MHRHAKCALMHLGRMETNTAVVTPVDGDLQGWIQFP